MSVSKNSHVTITINQLTVYRGQQRVIHQLSLSTSLGELIKINGPNGAGKSSLLLTLLGQIHSHSGEIYINDQSLTDIHPDQWRNLFTWLPQNSTFGEDTIVREIFDQSHSKNITKSQKQLIDILNCTTLITQLGGLNSKLSTYELSGGELQRLNLLRTCSRSAPVILLDEPETFLDHEMKERVYQLFSKLKSTHLIILISHSTYFDDLCDQIIHLPKQATVC